MKTILDLPIHDKQRIATEMKMSIVDWEQYMRDTLSKLRADSEQGNIDMSDNISELQYRFISDLAISKE